MWIRVDSCGFVGCRGNRWNKLRSLARGPPFSGLRIGEFSEKREVSVGEIWPLRGHFGIYSERIHKEPHREMGSRLLSSSSPKIGLKSTKISIFFDFSPTSILFITFYRPGSLNHSLIPPKVKVHHMNRCALFRHRIIRLFRLRPKYAQ